MGIVESAHLPGSGGTVWRGISIVPSSTEYVFLRGLPRAILTVGVGKDVRFREQEFISMSTDWPQSLQKRRLLLMMPQEFAAAQEPNVGQLS